MKYSKLSFKYSVSDPLIPEETRLSKAFLGLKRSNEMPMPHSHLALPDSSQEQNDRVTTGNFLHSKVAYGNSH